MGEQKTLDNPNDIALREVQKHVRVEQGLKVKAEVKIEPKFSAEFHFRFRKHTGTQFVGLWELCVTDPRGKVVEVITDADALPSVLDAIGNIFANEGY